MLLTELLGPDEVVKLSAREEKILSKRIDIALVRALADPSLKQQLVDAVRQTHDEIVKGRLNPG